MDIAKRRQSGFTIIAGFFFVAAVTAATASAPDVNEDGVVNIYDLSLVSSCFGGDPLTLPQCAPADLDEDGEISMDDINLVVDAFGQTVVANTPPTADAGLDQLAFVGDTVTLDGSNSSDSDGDALSFTWSLIETPLGSAAALVDENTVNPSFTVDLPGNYAVQLVANDGTEDSAPDVVIISTENSAPVADADADQLVFVGETATLNGGDSTDVDGDPLSFEWTLISVPDGSSAALSDPLTVNPTINIDLPGSYEVQLIVNDGIVDSSPDTVTIATENNPPVANAGTDQLAAVGDRIILDGGASSDIDSDELTFVWALTSVPSGSTALLSDPTSINPTFTIDLPGSYVAQLIVNDGLVDSAPDTVSVSTTNTAPIADAGPDQSLLVGDTVFLDGSGSFDNDGDELSYFWSFVSVPDGSLAALSDPTAIEPSFALDLSGDYVAQLIVNDGTSDSAPDTVTISTENTIPVADAGDDQSVLTGSTIALDGSGSSDADGDPLTYAWSLVAVPDGSSAIISDPTASNPTFTADLPGTYVAQLIVNDGTTSSAPDNVTITASEDNAAPIADAGDDLTVTVAETANLSAADSSDPDGDPLTYSWALVSAPSGSTTSLVGATTATPSLTPDVAGAYDVQLVVNDGELNSAPDTVTITASTPNTAPTADAGDDQAVTVGETASLSAAGSSDPDGDPLTYSWTIVSAPSGSTASLVGATTATPSLTPDVAGTYDVQLIVNDGELNSAPDTVTITASTPNTAPTADAGGDQAVTVGETASLSAAGSSDPDGDPLTYSWTLVTAPSGSTASLVGATTATPSLTPDVAGTYDVQLIVNDGELNSAPDTLTITAIALVSVVANNDLGSTPSDLAVILLVLDNDTPTAGLTVASVTQPADGQVTVNDDNTITYRQAGLAFESDGLNLYRSRCSSCHGISGFSGTDTFTYDATDGSTSDTASVTVNVTSFDSVGIDISGMAITSCINLPTIRQHGDCLGLTDSDIRTIGDFLIRGF